MTEPDGRRYAIGIVGAGPMCTYALGRLAAAVPAAGLGPALGIVIVDRTGRFGAGAVHSDEQPATSRMNRIAGQIAFAADESHTGREPLLPAGRRRHFVQWLADRHADTGNPRYLLDPQQAPARGLHGEALRDAFDGFVAELRDAGALVELVADDAVDLAEEPAPPGPAGYRLRCATSGDRLLDEVLLATGHPTNRPTADEAVLQRHASSSPALRYYPSSYPLAELAAIPAGSRVAITGLGLTAFDVILHLTEGRGGRFSPAADGTPARLSYQPSGREPAVIVAVSPSGLPVGCRPRNDKWREPGRLEHRPRFFTVEAVERLRQVAGRSDRKLDLDRLLPLLTLELGYVYYRTLLGTQWGDWCAGRLAGDFSRFLADPGAGAGLAAGLSRCLAETEQALTAGRWPAISSPAAGEPAPDPAVLTAQLHRTVTGWALAAGRPAPARPVLADYRFEVAGLLDPGSRLPKDPAGWQRGVLDLMADDLAAAVQGNLANPVKAATDGVWRDLRAVFSAVVQDGGLTPDAHREFDRVWLRFYNRLSNGAPQEVYARILALAESGLLDLSVGPEPRVSTGPGRFVVTGGLTGARTEVTVLVNGRSHPFDPAADSSPLYRNLLRRGLVRHWHNEASDQRPYQPGGLDSDRGGAVVRPDGTVNPRLSVLGLPAEGRYVFLASAARPFSNSSVLNAAADWADGAVDRARAAVRSAEPSPYLPAGTSVQEM